MALVERVLSAVPDGRGHACTAFAIRPGAGLSGKAPERSELRERDGQRWERR